MLDETEVDNMTDTEKLAALKAMVGTSDTDEVLSTYLKLSGNKSSLRLFRMTIL